MARIRTIRPSLLMRIRVLSDPGQDLRLRLPLACDDRGRARLDLAMFAAGLYPGQPGKSEHLPGMLDELERHGFIERYTVGDQAFLRVIDWERDQRVDHPTPSRLPPSPTESPEDSRARESIRTLQGRGGNWQADQPFAADASYSRESPAFLGSRVRESEEDAAARREALAALARIQGNAEEKKSHHAAIRAVIEQTKLRGLGRRLVVDPAGGPKGAGVVAGVEAAASAQTGDGASGTDPGALPPHVFFGLPAAIAKS